MSADETRYGQMPLDHLAPLRLNRGLVSDIAWPPVAQSLSGSSPYTSLTAAYRTHSKRNWVWVFVKSTLRTTRRILVAAGLMLADGPLEWRGRPSDDLTAVNDRKGERPARLELVLHPGDHFGVATEPGGDGLVFVGTGQTTSRSPAPDDEG